MPLPVQHSFLQNSYAAAREAARVGGALHVDRNGQLAVEGRGWLGRQVLRLKQRFFPGHVRARNMQLLNHLASRIQRDLNVPGVRDYLHARHDRLAGQPRNAKLLASHIAETIQQYDHVAGHGHPARNLASKHFDDLVGPQARGKMAFAARNPPPGSAARILIEAGSGDSVERLRGYKTRYEKFMARLAEAPELARGHTPNPTGESRSPCKNAAGEFTPAFHKAAMLVMLNREGMLDRSQLRQVRQPGASLSELNWLAQKYDGLKDAQAL